VLEIALFPAPTRDCVDNAPDQLSYACLTLRRSDLAVEILADHDVGRGLRPISRRLYVALLENNRPLIVANGSRSQLPLDLVIGGSAFRQMRSEVPREGDSDTLRYRHRPAGVPQFHSDT